MSSSDDAVLLGEAAPPVANGEPVFEAPWQSRVFAMARHLNEAGHFSWDEFRACLIAEIAAWEAAHPGEDYHYYDRFLEALQQLLEQKSLCTLADLGQRSREYAARPHGHDHHGHDHHGHDHHGHSH